MALEGNKLLRRAQEVLRTRLPEGWQTTFTQRTKRDNRRLDAQLEVSGPDGRTALLGVQIKRALEPRDVLALRAHLQGASTHELGVVVAPYLSPAVRLRLTEQGFGFLDLTGNIRMTNPSPALFIETSGAQVNPDRQSRPSRSLRGEKAGRIVRALIDRKLPPGVRELAENTKVNPGYVSRIVALLDREALVERSRGRILSVDWPRLLKRWAEDAPMSSRGTQTTCIDPRGLTALISRLPKINLRYAITGSFAVQEFAPVAAPRLAILYVDDVRQGLEALELRVADRGANVILIEPDDEFVFEGSAEREGVQVVAVSQAAADLLSSPGRGPAEAEALIGWMRAHEEVWRG